VTSGPELLTEEASGRAIARQNAFMSSPSSREWTKNCLFGKDVGRIVGSGGNVSNERRCSWFPPPLS
jgi:hypothetical protein